MLKFLMFLTLLTCSSFLVTDAFSIEVELLKESDRIMDTLGWLELGNEQYQEHLQIMINQIELKNKISVLLVSTDDDDIYLPFEYKHETWTDPRIISIILTNQFNCASGTDDACITITVEREGNVLPTIKENARKITDPVLEEGMLGFSPKFHSIS